MNGCEVSGLARVIWFIGLVGFLSISLSMILFVYYFITGLLGVRRINNGNN
jgi:hypothetical protein